MRYVDGFVIPIAKKHVKSYIRLARSASQIWRKHGALEYFECVGDDLKIKGIVSFPKLTRLKPGETVFFSFIVYKSRAHRDRVNAKVMKDPFMLKMTEGMPMPFDVKRMTCGGFKSVVEF